MGRRSALGRGLGALIPSDSTGGLPATSGSDLRHLPLASIRPNPQQPRRHFDEESLDELTASIRALGILQPVLVRPAGDDLFELVAGERRWRAAKRAGIPTLPAIVRPLDDPSSLAQAVVENLQREDLNPLETAAAYQQLIDKFGLTHEQVASQVGKSRVAITNSLRLFQLSAVVQQLVAGGELSAGSARALLGTSDRGLQDALARRAVKDGLSVRDVERAVRERESSQRSTTKSPSPPVKLRAAGLAELEELLGEHLDTRVKVELGPKKGKITIEFADLADLERIYRRMSQSS